MNERMEILSEKLSDERGRRILLVSHCILNENARSQGEAFRKGLNEGIVEQARRAGVGIVQMPCPEQRVWGGVSRPFMWLLLGRRGTLLYALRRPFLALFTWYTRWRWRTMARRVAREMADFVRSGSEIVGVVGVSASPSCGVHRTLDLVKGTEYIACTSLESLRRDEFNRDGIRAAVVPGDGLYFQLLREALRRRGIDAPFFEHNLLAEIEGKPEVVQLDLAPAEARGSC